MKYSTDELDLCGRSLDETAAKTKRFAVCGKEVPAVQDRFSKLFDMAV